MKKVKILYLSDIHLGNERNKASSIIKNLDNFFDHYTDNSRFANIDAIMLAGDLFDKGLSFSSTATFESLEWMGRLMRFCYRRKIALRILRGTISHDREQPKVSEIIYRQMKEAGKDFDFRYVDTLCVEFMEKIQRNVLFVPDEWNADNAVTLKQVKQLMAEMNLKTVEVATMHGSFKYQLPGAPETIPMHSEPDYLSLVTEHIGIGHVHKYSVFEHIVPQGSFDRLAHGEEEPKGGVLVTLSDSGPFHEFIENKGAKIFKTVEVKHKDVDRSMEQLRKAVRNLPDDSYVRVKTTKDHPLYRAFDMVQKEFFNLNFEKKSIEEIEDDYELISSMTSSDFGYTAIPIHRDNIIGLITDAVNNKRVLNPEQKLILQQTLEQINAAH